MNLGVAAAADGLVKDTTTQTFMKDVIEESRRQPVLVDFWAPWCGPCKQLTPALEKAVRAAKGKAKLAKLNIDEHKAIFQQLAAQLGIQSIPAVIAFANGCSYRRRLESWLGAGKVHADRVMEFQSYHAIVACVAAGSGIAVVPKSVLEMTAAGRQVNVVRLPPSTARAKTCLVWRPGHHSLALEALKATLAQLLPAKRAA